MSQHENTPIAVFCISSGSVAGAHALLNKPNPLVLASNRSDAPLQEDINIDRFINETVKSLEDVITKLGQADLHHPKKIEVVLSTPWYVSQTRTIVYKKDTPFTCTEKLVDALLEKEIDHIIKNDMKTFGSLDAEGLIIEKQLSGILLNGYPTVKPYGKKARTFECALTITVSSKTVIDRFIHTIKRTYGGKHISVTTAPNALYIAMRDMDAMAHEECFIVEVGEEMTTIAFVKKGVFLYQHSFPLGTNTVYRTIASATVATIAEAKALLESFRLDTLLAPQKKSIQAAITTFSAQWQHALEEALSAGHFGFSLPSQCYVQTDDAFVSLISQALASDPLVQHTVTGPVKINALSQEAIGKLFPDHTVVDAALAAGILFVDRIM